MLTKMWRSLFFVLSSSSSSDPISPWTWLLWLYLSVETLFLAAFIFYIVPRCNQRTAPKPYRDYGLQHRHQLFLRIVHRIERTCHAKHRNVRPAMEEFLSHWFRKGRRWRQEQQQDRRRRRNGPLNNYCDNNNDNHHQRTPPRLITSSSTASTLSSPSSSFDDSWSIDGASSSTDEDDDGTSMGGLLHKDDVEEFLSGAFFGKTYVSLSEVEMRELQIILDLFLQRTKIPFLLPGKSSCFQPLRLSLEDMNPIPRPLLVYLIVAVCKTMAILVLWCLGFHRHITTTGLVYWFRPSTTTTEDDQHLPFLFFHGIAPAGFALYLPMVLCGLANDGRPIFLFENQTISCTLGFHAVTEDETVQGVQEALDRHLPPNVDICLCGHSFGSCQLTWLLHSSLQRRIRQFILLDPVSILLSEPDVLASFLYSNPCRRTHATTLSTTAQSNDWWYASLSDWLVRLQLRLVASSEVFTEYYLRRHFCWYNSELWLDDVPPHVQVLVCLAERDEIANTSKVQDEIDLYNNHHSASKVQVIFWNKVGHGYCVASPTAWQSMKQAMIEQERRRANVDPVNKSTAVK